MSRIDELKKQYPEFNINMFDVLKTIDKSKSYKYMSLLCKIISGEILGHYPNEEHVKIEMIDRLNRRGYHIDEKVSFKEIILLNLFTDNIRIETTDLISEFIDYMENNKIENKDLTTYKTTNSIREAVSLAQIKEYRKDLETQVIKEHEDDTWLCLRPLTFSASARYGAATKWCTTSKNQKEHFERYWRRGILVYFINKKTGYKFAGFKALGPHDDEFSFWNAEDVRVDFMFLDIEDYMFSVVKKIFSSKHTNKELASDEIQENVHTECLELSIKKDMLSEVGYVLPPEEELIEQRYDYQENIVVDQPRFISPGPENGEYNAELNYLADQLRRL
jgi:hypothetical protein